MCIIHKGSEVYITANFLPEITQVRKQYMWVLLYSWKVGCDILKIYIVSNRIIAKSLWRGMPMRKGVIKIYNYSKSSKKIMQKKMRQIATSKTIDLILTTYIITLHAINQNKC